MREMKLADHLLQGQHGLLGRSALWPLGFQGLQLLLDRSLLVVLSQLVGIKLGEAIHH